jgi:hypothetical protein
MPASFKRMSGSSAIRDFWQYHRTAQRYVGSRSGLSHSVAETFAHSAHSALHWSNVSLALAPFLLSCKKAVDWLLTSHGSLEANIHACFMQTASSSPTGSCFFPHIICMPRTPRFPILFAATTYNWTGTLLPAFLHRGPLCPSRSTQLSLHPPQPCQVQDGSSLVPTYYSPYRILFGRGKPAHRMYTDNASVLQRLNIRIPEVDAIVPT